MKNNKDIKKCPYCNFVFIPTPDDIDMVDKIETYWCPNCGEQFVENLEIKNNYTKYNKRDWQ